MRRRRSLQGDPTSPDEARYRSLLKFDVAGTVPTGVTITSATLHQYHENYSGAADDVSAYRMTSGWTTDPATVPYADSTTYVEEVDEWYTWDVTRMVKAWYSGAHANQGMLLGHPGGDLSGLPPVFTSNEGDPSTRPYLEVTYTSPVCPSSDPFAAAQSSSADTVYAWNQILLDVFREAGGAPAPLARAAAMKHVGIYDVLNSGCFAHLEDLSTGTPTPPRGLRLGEVPRARRRRMSEHGREPRGRVSPHGTS